MLPLLAAVAFALAPQDRPQLDPSDPRITPEVLVIKRVAPSVVYIEAERPMPAFTSHGLTTVSSSISGSGVVIERSGYIVTNHHVVAGASKVQVQFDPEHDPVVYRAQIVSSDPSEDLALLKIVGKSDFPVVSLGTSSDLMLGERVIVIGNPYRQRLSVSTGIISGLHRNLEIDPTLRFPDLIQTDASINPGNSGGPVLNIYGEMIGMATVVRPQAENMGYAIPIDRIKEVLSEELLAPSAAKAYLGFDLGAESLEVAAVQPSGPASAGGLAVGDRITHVDGEPVATAQEFNLKRLPLVPGAPIRLAVSRAGKPLELTLQGWTKADGILYERMGLTVERVVVGGFPLVGVATIAPEGPAELLGLARGDVIQALRVAGGPVCVASTPASLARWVRTLERGNEISLDVLRDADKDGEIDRDQERFRGAMKVR